MLLRLEFTRGRELMFLSHLDIMRTFGRAMRRGGIPVRYSEGYNPHALMVFGLPLQVGVTAGAEYLDIELTRRADADEIAGALNAALPRGLSVTAAREKKTDANVMSLITHAAYEMRVGTARRGGEGEGEGEREEGVREVEKEGDRENEGVREEEKEGDRESEEVREEEKEGERESEGESEGEKEGVDDSADRELCSDALASAVAAFRLPGARIVEKKSGKRDGGRGKKRGGVRLIDLAPLVRHISARGDIVEMTVKAGSVDNVKPELVLQALNKIYIESVTPGTKTATWVPCAVTSPGEENACGGFYKIWVRRTALYAERGGVLLKPIDDEVC